MESIKLRLKPRSLLASLILSLLLWSCQKEALPPQTQLHLGTVCTINLFDDGTIDLYTALFKRLKEIEQVFSVRIAASTISQVNQAAGIAAVAVPEEVLLVLQQALDIAKKTGGAFDPTIGPLVDLWDIGGDNSQVPSQEAIDHARSLVDYRLVELNLEQGTVYLPKQGMALDLGGIAKGYAASKVAEKLKSDGADAMALNAGGNIVTIGLKPGNEQWITGIKNPNGTEANSLICRVTLGETSLVTSGNYERYFLSDGKIYHHIIDPETRMPAEHFASVSVFTPNGGLADALSTALFCMSYEEGLALIEEIDGVEALWVCHDGTIKMTKGVSLVND